MIKLNSRIFLLLFSLVMFVGCSCDQWYGKNSPVKVYRMNVSIEKTKEKLLEIRSENQDLIFGNSGYIKFQSYYKNNESHVFFKYKNNYLISVRLSNGSYDNSIIELYLFKLLTEEDSYYNLYNKEMIPGKHFGYCDLSEEQRKSAITFFDEKVISKLKINLGSSSETGLFSSLYDSLK